MKIDLNANKSNKSLSEQKLKNIKRKHNPNYLYITVTKLN